jgi:hypothetical protein
MVYNMLMNKKILIGARLTLGFATLFAVIAQAWMLYANHIFDPFNYLGYFTNLSNIVAAIFLIISAVYLARSRKPTPQGDLLRGAATVYMTVTGLVYITLLSGEDLGLLMPWVNILLHIIMPLGVIADWLYQPPLSKISAKRALWWLAFPLLFLGYTIIRGAATGWYPYPFLDPDKAGGYGGVTLYCIGILAAFLLVSWGIRCLGNSLKRHTA